ncbi:hypothetical protein BD413DRAFT_276335 [Trametes elegans]|nr:hypothetical protein BD413DRAFT_276335 [Trametes elegans]
MYNVHSVAQNPGAAAAGSLSGLALAEPVHTRATTTHLERDSSVTGPSLSSSTAPHRPARLVFGRREPPSLPRARSAFPSGVRGAPNRALPALPWPAGRNRWEENPSWSARAPAGCPKASAMLQKGSVLTVKLTNRSARLQERHRHPPTDRPSPPGAS